ncbi:hypothetical protein L249_6575 [Ophiocordyceps polyrhachis-furcata BCC 54312]|uniref:Uncharacterized protein n=1 Tax=Ophiocordyceps polyrhachis-furcata BCC 54312 TaxID=1330021 RepID=A0A367LKH6_9HYPO|nr:hypothetical protein L249_6575 [Ophiocordyceps polyrhachis-furcata BCC 54312]
MFLKMKPKDFHLALITTLSPTAIQSIDEQLNGLLPRTRSKLLCVTTRGQKGTKTQIKSHPPPYLVLLARDAKPMRRLS